MYFSDARDFADIGITTMSSSITFTKMLPLQHDIAINWDDMEHDIDLHENIEALNDRFLMVAPNQYDTDVSDEVQRERGASRLVKTDAREAALYYTAFASLRDDHSTMQSTLEATELNIHEYIDTLHGAQSTMLPLIVGMDQMDSGVEDEARSEHGVPRLAKMDAIHATLHEQIDTSQSMNFEHFGVTLSTFHVLESNLHEEITNLRGNHSAEHFGIEAADYNVYEKIDVFHGPHPDTPAFMVGMTHNDSYVSDKGRNEGVPLLANMEAIDATLLQEEIACLRDDHSTRHSTMDATYSNVHEKTDVSRSAQYAILPIMVSTDERDNGVKDEVQRKSAVLLLAKVEATEAVPHDTIGTFQSMHADNFGTLRSFLETLEFKLQEEMFGLADNHSAKHLGTEATVSNLYEKVAVLQGVQFGILTTSFMVGMVQKDSCIGDKANINYGVPHTPPVLRRCHVKSVRSHPMVDWMYTQTFRKMLKTWPAHVEYPNDVENITSAQYNWARSQWPTGVPMIESF